MEELQHQYHLEEYRALRSEIELRIKEGHTLETFSVAGIAAVYAWLATHIDTGISEFGWWIPALFPVLGIMRQLGVWFRMEEIAKYTQAIETTFKLKKPPGWETYLDNKRKKEPHKSQLLSLSSLSLWIAMFLVTILIGFIA